MNDSEFEPVEGSGNVFRDFGDPQADLRQAKAIIAARIIAVLDERKLAVRKAADATGFPRRTSHASGTRASVGSHWIG